MWQALVVIRGTYVNDVERAFVGLHLPTFPMTFVFAMAIVPSLTHGY
jgi:hypothetical protein